MGSADTHQNCKVRVAGCGQGAQIIFLEREISRGRRCVQAGAMCLGGGGESLKEEFRAVPGSGIHGSPLGTCGGHQSSG